MKETIMALARNDAKRIRKQYLNVIVSEFVIIVSYYSFALVSVESRIYDTKKFSELEIRGANVP